MRELAKLYIAFSSISDEDVTVEDLFKREHQTHLAETITRRVSKCENKEKHGQKLFLNAVILRSVKP